LNAPKSDWGIHVVQEDGNQDTPLLSVIRFLDDPVGIDGVLCPNDYHAARVNQSLANVARPRLPGRDPPIPKHSPAPFFKGVNEYLDSALVLVSVAQEEIMHRIDLAGCWSAPKGFYL
jgi:hypothetical protein